MGRTKVSLRIDSDKLRAAMKAHDGNWSEFAQKYGVTKQAVSNWLSEGLIPPRAIAEIARELSLHSDVIDEILSPQSDYVESKNKRVFAINATIEIREVKP